MRRKGAGGGPVSPLVLQVQALRRRRHSLTLRRTGMRPIGVVLLTWWFVMQATAGQWQPAARGWAVSRQRGVRAGAALLDAARVPDVATVLPRLITGLRGRVGHALLRARDAVAFCSQRLVGGVRVWQITSGSAATRAATAAAACWC